MNIIDKLRDVGKTLERYNEVVEEDLTEYIAVVYEAADKLQGAWGLLEHLTDFGGMDKYSEVRVNAFLGRGTTPKGPGRI